MNYTLYIYMYSYICNLLYTMIYCHEYWTNVPWWYFSKGNFYKFSRHLLLFGKYSSLTFTHPLILSKSRKNYCIKKLLVSLKCTATAMRRFAQEIPFCKVGDTFLLGQSNTCSNAFNTLFSGLNIKNFWTLARVKN